jgi:hypothetical protein
MPYQRTYTEGVTWPSQVDHLHPGRIQGGNLRLRRAGRQSGCDSGGDQDLPVNPSGGWVEKQFGMCCLFLSPQPS